MAVLCPFCDKLARLVRLADLPADELIWQTPNSVVLLGPWQFFHGYCILVARKHVAELHHLNSDERNAFVDDLCRLAAAIEAEFQPRKLNCELLGNQVPHLHWHLFPRYRSDVNHLQAVWLDIHRAESDSTWRERLLTGPSSRLETVDRIRRRLAAI
jgi:diadenosine tetraphosphate (Ap4A) HIT family hydrolase